MSSPVLQWFIEQTEMFAPGSWREERQRLYADLLVLNPSEETPLPLDDNICLFVLAQVVAVRQLSTPATGKLQRGRNAHETWYSKERQRIAKLLQQIAESPVVASFHTTLHYYAAEDVTCPHGRNQKTCDALYALRLTLRLLERYPAIRGVRKQVERLRHLEPHLPQLSELCTPQKQLWQDATALYTSAVEEASEPPSTSPSTWMDERALYLLGTAVSRLRHAGLSVAQSCALVDRILLYCFDLPDPHGTRPALLAEQWRHLC